MLVWLGQAVNSKVAPIRTTKTAAFFNTIMASPLMFSLISGEAMMMPQRSTKAQTKARLSKVLACASCVFVCAFCGLLAETPNRSARQINPNALHLRVQVKRVPAHLAAVARLFITTEGRRCIEHVVSIDPNNTRLDLFRETMRAGDVSGPDAGRQTVDRIVRLFDQIVLV